jgi:hypothetical protein
MTPHPLAPHHLPQYLSGPDGSDPLFTAVIVLLVILLMVIGNLYFKLHAIPERMAHKHNNTQLQIITVLAILALFTHNNIFWVAALLLAVVRLPDFTTPINSIAKSLEQLAQGSSTEAAPTLNEQKETSDAAKEPHASNQAEREA